MKYLQCHVHLTRVDRAEHLWLDARAVSECRFDLDGHLTHGG